MNDNMFERNLYFPIVIQSAEHAMLFPAGTVAVGFEAGDEHKEFPVSETKREDYWTGPYPNYETPPEELVGWTALVVRSEKEFLAGFANWLEGGTPRAYSFEHPCYRGEFWYPTIEEQKLMDAVDVIRETIGWKESLR